MNIFIKPIFLSLLFVSALYSDSEPKNQGSNRPIGIAMIAAAAYLSYYSYTLALEIMGHRNEYRRMRHEIEQVEGVRIKKHYEYYKDSCGNYYRIELHPTLKLKNISPSKKEFIREEWYKACKSYRLIKESESAQLCSLAIAFLLGCLGCQLY